ncbi:hypothetical protein [Nonomuraea sp. NPDC049750]|uniref:hypothetical protein n=1 Tax=Nonomuraea sp. NPDC049750 TaxID=3154738 RepID=UPI0033D409F9
MSTRHQDSESLIPQPPLTTAPLRAAVAQIAPAYLSQFVDHLDQATEQAARQSTVAPLQNVLQQWGEFVAIQRHPPVPYGHCREAFLDEPRGHAMSDILRAWDVMNVV